MRSMNAPHPPEAPRFIEDWRAGETLVLGPAVLGEDEILAFARDYDPQPMHTDPDYAAGGPFGGVIASGFQTVALAFSLVVRHGVFGTNGLGGPGMDEIRWLKPVKPGDRLTNHVTVLEARRSGSKPDRGLLRLGHDLRNQQDESVLTFTSMSIVRARGT